MAADETTAFRYGEKFSISEVLGRAGKRPQTETEPDRAANDVQAPPEVLTENIGTEEAEPLPGPGDAYRAHSRVSLRPLPMLCFIWARGGFKILSYGNLESIDFVMPELPGASPALVLLFAGMKPVELRLEGRNLVPLADMLRRQALAWIRECPAGRGPAGDAETVITGMRLEAVQL